MSQHTRWLRLYFFIEVIDGRVVRVGTSVTWNVLSWAGGHKCTPQSDWIWGASYFCSKSHLNQKFLHCYPDCPSCLTHLNRIDWVTWADLICLWHFFQNHSMRWQGNLSTEEKTMTEETRIRYTSWQSKKTHCVWLDVRGKTLNNPIRTCVNMENDKISLLPRLKVNGYFQDNRS